MKILLLTITLLLTACYEKGEVVTAPNDFIEIHGKVYKLMRIAPNSTANAIWILYPKDSNDTQPTVLNYDVSDGESTSNQTVVKID